MADILIDGSVLEGGGQVVRNAVSLSGLLSRPVSIHKIRNNRNSPGLRNHHRKGLELAASIASARLTGAKNGSREIEFVPGCINLPNQYTTHAGKAGSITLVLQVALPLLLFSPTSVPASTLTLTGATNAATSPQVDTIKHLFLPFIQRHFGIDNVALDIKKRGYFRKGGGEVALSIVPLSVGQKLRSFSLMERGNVKRIAGICHSAGLSSDVGNDMVVGATRCLAKAGFGESKVKKANEPGGATESNEQPKDGNIPVSIATRREPDGLTRGTGSGIVLWAELEGGGMIGGSALGAKGLSPEKVGEEAAEELIKGLSDGGCVDEPLQDQIIIFMALAEGKSEVRCGTAGLSQHTRTAIWVTEQLTDAKFEVEEEPSGHVVIRCQGIGYSAPSPMINNAKP